MNFIETFKSAIQSLKGNKMRSLLTMLGIIIGISSVIAMSAIGTGGQKKISGTLAKSGFGVYNLSIDKDADSYRSSYDFDSRTVESIKENGVYAVAPFITERTDFYDAKKKRLRGVIYGTTEDYEKIEEVEYIYGRPILRQEFDSVDPVIVIDNITAKKIFGYEYPLGEKVEVNLKGIKQITQFTVVGIFRHPEEGLNEAGLARFMPSYGRISMPLMERLMYDDKYANLLIQTDDPETAREKLDDIITMLETDNTEEIYEYEERVARGSSFDEILGTLRIFITFVASISLFVGGIGVMNIMLVSVTERIKEIGIRKAIGARNIDILAQFLTEAVVLSVSGGIIGIIIGILGAEIIGGFVSIPPVFSTPIILMAVLVSTLIGVLFGVYPARQASLMNPIDALRNE